jgi:hypothetical protein
MIIIKRSLTLFGKTSRRLQNSPDVATRIFSSSRAALPALCDFFLLFSKNCSLRASVTYSSGISLSTDVRSFFYALISGSYIEHIEQSCELLQQLSPAAESKSI